MKDTNGVELKAGQVCMVSPSKTSQMRKSYYVTVFEDHGGLGKCSLSDNLCTYKRNGHAAAINEYMLSRLTVIGSVQHHQHLL